MPTFDGALGQDSVRPWVKLKRWTDRVDLRVFQPTVHHLPILTAAGPGEPFGNQKCILHWSSLGENILHHTALTWESPDNPHVELHVGMVLQALQAVELSSSQEFGEEGISICHHHLQQVEVLMIQTNPTMCEMM